jgi:hypothetical protein
MQVMTRASTDFRSNKRRLMSATTARGFRCQVQPVGFILTEHKLFAFAERCTNVAFVASDHAGCGHLPGCRQGQKFEW